MEKHSACQLWLAEEEDGLPSSRERPCTGTPSEGFRPLGVDRVAAGCCSGKVAPGYSMMSYYAEQKIVDVRL